MKTTDLWFASFLKLKGIKLIDFEILSRGKGKFCFEISDEQWKLLRLEFMNSEISKTKQIMSELKDLLY